jgi:hypothetical protein
MPFFSRRHDRDGYHPTVPGLDEYAASQDWRALNNPFDGMLSEMSHEFTRVMYGAPRGQKYVGNSSLRVGQTDFRPAYGGSLGGRDITVANGWTSIIELRPIAITTMELPMLVPLAWVQPRTFAAPARLREISLGDQVFEQRFAVHAQDPGFTQALLTPEIRQLIMARDNWVFMLESFRLACLSRESFGSVDHVLQRLAEMQAIVTAIPASMMPAQVDHSGDALADLLGESASFEDAQAKLHSLDPEQRAQMDSAGNPLSMLGGASSAEDAKEKFMSMDADQRAQLVAELLRARDKRRRS